jgi:hypothetical protein
MSTYADLLKSAGIKTEGVKCVEGMMEWAACFTDPQAAWDACPNGNWMLFLLGNTSGAQDSPRRKSLTAFCVNRLLDGPGDITDPRIDEVVLAIGQWTASRATITDIQETRKFVEKLCGEYTWRTYFEKDPNVALASNRIQGLWYIIVGILYEDPRDTGPCFGGCLYIAAFHRCEYRQDVLTLADQIRCFSREQPVKVAEVSETIKFREFL